MADPGDVRRRHQWPSVQSSRRVTERRNYREEVEKGGGGWKRDGGEKEGSRFGSDAGVYATSMG